MKVTEIQSGHQAGTSESQVPSCLGSEDGFGSKSVIIADASLAALQGCLRPAEDTHGSQNDTIRNSVETTTADKKVTISQASSRQKRLPLLHFTDEEIKTHCLGYLPRSIAYK